MARALGTAGDIAANDVKRLVTKSGNRLQLSDKPGVETVLLATPHHSRIQLTEKADSTGRSNITLETDIGDIVLHAPQGRVHIESLYYSKEIGAEDSLEAQKLSADDVVKVSSHIPTTKADQKSRVNQVKLWRARHKEAITKAIADQRKLLLKRRSDLLAWDDVTKKSVRTWAGSDSPGTRETLLLRTDKELALNRKLTLNNFQPPEPGKADPDNFAYVYPNDPKHTIYLDQQFDQAPATGYNSKAGTLAHEMSHFKDIAGTQDYQYGADNARVLAEVAPQHAISNADNYEFFIEGIK